MGWLIAASEAEQASTAAAAVVAQVLGAVVLQLGLSKRSFGSVVLQPILCLRSTLLTRLPSSLRSAFLVARSWSYTSCNGLGMYQSS